MIVKKTCGSLDVLLFAILCSSVCRAAQLAEGIKIIPQPKQIETANENFSLKNGAKINLANSRSADDRFAAQDFI
jgi:hypothetical protein